MPKARYSVPSSRCILTSLGFICLWAVVPAFAAGPDLIVGEIGVTVDGDSGEAFLTLGPVGGVMAYGFSTEACNVGDAPVSWLTNGPPEQRNQHPVIAQNMFRLKDGRFEQIGQSWLKHAFCGTNESLCGTCPVENQTSCGSLAVGCSDPYGAYLNTKYPIFHLRLGPKSDVNAATVDGNDIASFVAMYVGDDVPSACADAAEPSAGALDAADVDAFGLLLLAGDSP